MNPKSLEAALADLVQRQRAIENDLLTAQSQDDAARQTWTVRQALTEARDEKSALSPRLALVQLAVSAVGK